MTMTHDARTPTRWLVFVLIFAGLAALVVAVGVAYYWQAGQTLRSQAGRELEAIARLKANQISRWRQERHWHADALFRNRSFNNLVERALSPSHDAEAQGQLEELLQQYRANAEYDRVFLFDAQGTARLSLAPAGEAPSATLAQAASVTLGSDDTTFIDFYMDEHDGRPHLATLIPIVDDRIGHRILGVVAMRLDPEAFLFPFISGWPTTSMTGETLLVRRDGSDALYLSLHPFLSTRLPLTETGALAVQAVLGMTGVAEGLNHRGEPTLGVLQPVEGSPWFLVAQVDLAQFGKLLRARLKVIVLIAAVLLLAAGAGLGLAWRNQFAALYRQQTELSTALEKLNTELEARVEARTADLVTANKELEAFSYSVSHDLRAPLRALQGFSRILLDEHLPELSRDAVHYVEMIRDNAAQMGLLIDDLLRFSRLSRQQLQTTAVSVTDLTRWALDQLEPELRNRTVDMQVVDLPPCQGDPALLRQVLMNLVANALKFTRPRTQAAIEVGEAPGEARPGERVFYVRDNGVGFDMQYAAKLFGVFQRLHAATDFPGTGVGLAIVQRIIHRHGGRVWAEGALDRGATFYFTIPKETAHER